MGRAAGVNPSASANQLSQAVAVSSKSGAESAGFRGKSLLEGIGLLRYRANWGARPARPRLPRTHRVLRSVSRVVHSAEHDGRWRSSPRRRTERGRRRRGSPGTLAAMTYGVPGTLVSPEPPARFPVRIPPLGGWLSGSSRSPRWPRRWPRRPAPGRSKSSP